MHLRIRALALSLTLIILASLPVARAQTESPPARLGIVGGFRQNVGEMGDLYRLGWLLGVNAGYQGSWIPIGILWSVMFGQFYSNDPGNVDPDLSIVEMSFGLNGRKLISQASFRYLFAGAGVTLLRSESSLPPGDERTFIGPYVGGGIEQYLLGKYLVSVEARYGLLFGGPAGVSLNVAVNFGTF